MQIKICVIFLIFNLPSFGMNQEEEKQPTSSLLSMPINCFRMIYMQPACDLQSIFLLSRTCKHFYTYFEDIIEQKEKSGQGDIEWMNNLIDNTVPLIYSIMITNKEVRFTRKKEKKNETININREKFEDLKKIMFNKCTLLQLPTNSSIKTYSTRISQDHKQKLASYLDVIDTIIFPKELHLMNNILIHISEPYQTISITKIDGKDNFRLLSYPCVESVSFHGEIDLHNLAALHKITSLLNDDIKFSCHCCNICNDHCHLSKDLINKWYKLSEQKIREKNLQDSIYRLDKLKVKLLILINESNQLINEINELKKNKKKKDSNIVPTRIDYPQYNKLKFYCMSSFCALLALLFIYKAQNMKSLF